VIPERYNPFANSRENNASTANRSLRVRGVTVSRGFAFASFIKCAYLSGISAMLIDLGKQKKTGLMIPSAITNACFAELH
jgi:hypothetical protein